MIADMFLKHVLVIAEILVLLKMMRKNDENPQRGVLTFFSSSSPCTVREHYLCCHWQLNLQDQEARVARP